MTTLKLIGQAALMVLVFPLYLLAAPFIVIALIIFVKHLEDYPEEIETSTPMGSIW